uniref:Insulin-like domain-containing protein n=2 Tax=Anabas testudineus TaxID=64144 RepID=A0A3Q1J014_ANATE
MVVCVCVCDWDGLRTTSSISNMRALVVLPLLLWAMVCVVQVRAEMKAVKLCGREFLRAVVYTCGGSRWRRILTESDIDGLSTGEQSSLESFSSISSGSQLTRRDSNMLTTVCCQVGCRKSDLTFLC